LTDLIVLKVFKACRLHVIKGRDTNTGRYDWPSCQVVSGHVSPSV